MDNKKILRFGTIAAVVLIVLFGITVLIDDTRGFRKVDTSVAMAQLNDNNVKEVQIDDREQRLRLTLKNGINVDKRDGVTEIIAEYPARSAPVIFDKVQASNPEKYTTKVNRENFFTSMLGMLLPMLILFGLIMFFFNRMQGGGMGMFGFGGSRAKELTKDMPTNTFADVAGADEAVDELHEIKDFLQDPSRYEALGAKIPRGVLLYGPPGTGKTLLARAVAGEAGVPFYSISGSDFVEMFVGVGASRVRDLFAKAKEKAPCIVFIDEIDAVGRARSNSQNLGGNDERENTLNQLLTEMDGFGSNSGIIILAATNRVDILDGALTRAGRFDRQIFVDLPDINDRKEIFTVHLKNIKTDSSLDLDLLARQTPGFSGADIANICNEAALIAARNEKEFVSRADFMNAVDRIIGGLEKKNAITTSEERRSIAIHEAGHAVVSWFLEYANPLVKVTIVPRGKALGAAWYLPEERQITTTQALLDQMCATLAGRAAEEIFLGRISTGAANDLERITQLAYAMVVYYGMSDKLPNVNYSKIQGDAYGISKPYSDKTSELIDQEVNAIIAQQYQRAKDLLQEKAEGHKALSDLLLEAEVIYTEDVERLLGKRQWTSRADEIKAANEERGNKLTEPEPSTDSDNNKENCSLASDAEQL